MAHLKKPSLFNNIPERCMEAPPSVHYYDYGSFRIKYCNSCTVYSQKEKKQEKVNVHNEVCHQEGNELIKVTQIRFEEKIIKIEDKFEIMRECQKPSSEDLKIKINREQKDCHKIHLFNFNKFKGIGAPLKKDKKNIVKNIVKMFISWIRQNSKNQKERFRESQIGIKNILKVFKFNNKLIKQILKKPSLSNYFKQFLQSSAHQYIQESNIHDKETHHQAVNLYLSLNSIMPDLNDKLQTEDDQINSLLNQNFRQ